MAYINFESVPCNCTHILGINSSYFLSGFLIYRYVINSRFYNAFEFGFYIDFYLKYYKIENHFIAFI